MCVVEDYTGSNSCQLKGQAFIYWKNCVDSVIVSTPRITSVQYCGGCSLLRGISSVLWGIASVHLGDSISTAEAIQYCGVDF